MLGVITAGNQLSTMPNSATRTRGLLWAVTTLLFAVYFLSCFSPALLDDADSTHAEAAREMALTGDFVTLRVNGVRYLEKAPLMYWAVAFCYRIFGANEFATRLPLFTATLLLAFLGFVWGQRAFGETAGGYTAMFLPSAIGFYLFTRILIPEVILTLLLAAALFCLVMALSEARPGWWYGLYAATALGVLTKGLIAIAFVGGPAVLYLLLSGEWRRWREFRVLSGTVLFTAIVAPWHILAGLRNEGFFWFYFVNEHFLRFLGRRYPKDYNKLPAAAYWAMHLAWLFPWSLYLPLALKDLKRFRGMLRPPLTLESRSRLLLWIFAAFILVFFAFSTNQEYYTFPVYFPICLLTADAVAHAEVRNSRYLRWAGWGLVGIGVIAGGALSAALWTSRNLPYVSDVGTLLERRGVGEYTLSMSHFFDLTGSAFAGLRLPAVLAVTALVGGPVAALALRRRGRHQFATATISITMAVFLFAAHLALNRFEPFLSSSEIARILRPRLAPSDKLFIYGDQASGSSLLFYLQRPINLVNGRSTSMEFGSRFPDAPKIFFSTEDFLRAWHSEGRVYLFAPRERAQEVQRILQGTGTPVVELSGKAIYVNSR